jgi:hypothetical protein
MEKLTVSGLVWSQSHTASFTCHHLQIGDLSKPLSRVQIDENHKVQGLDCMVDGRELQILVPEGFPWYGQLNEGRRCSATKERHATIFLSG